MSKKQCGDDDRYSIQRRVARVGPQGQKRIGEAKAVVVGVGALGGTIASLLVRGGIGEILLIDDDRVEKGNLHRQILFTEADARANKTKVKAAERTLTEASSLVSIKTRAERLEDANAVEILKGASIVLDATDNLSTRFVINTTCVALGIPWIYGGVVATMGMVMPVVPAQGGACLRCLFEPPKGEEEAAIPSTATHGVIGPAPAAIAALQVGAAFRILVGDFAPPTQLWSIDVWQGTSDVVTVNRSDSCPLCGAGKSSVD